MAKKILKFKCEQTNGSATQSGTLLVIEKEEKPVAKPGEPIKRTARSILQARFAEDLLSFGQEFFKAGKTYQVTFEEVK